ncbi:exodeoxyribonuclease VII large subunit [Arthrobacter sp. GCM10027362]|uniref:exodeoxyribonuclease VII large subunit n=1 Tax=Arthrobacter sp. GCM10027362 TaxID=3273379 RepID=UPI00362F382D
MSQDQSWPASGAGIAEAPAQRTTLPPTASQTSPENPWPLRLLSEKLKAHIDRVPPTWVEGQVIELNRRNSVTYLTLRDTDAEASFSLVAWGNVMSRLEVPLQPGSRVVAQIKPDLYVKTGRLSMQTRDIRPVGLGDLLARLERLRQALAAEGLFADARKKRLPMLPHRIGLITGRDSDAMKDVIRNASLRWPAVAFEVREVAVQGVTAVTQVMQALAELDAMAEVDVIVIARGGGSLEDLLPFSSEELVRAVAAARTPVVSAIGHEADRPLLDDVADLRASTPTDAAKRIVPDVGEELERIARARAMLSRSVETMIRHESERLAAVRSRPVLANPHGMIQARAEELQRLSARAYNCISAAVDRDRDRIVHLRAQVRALSPQNTLDRGYAVVQLPDGAVLRDAQDAPPGTRLRVRVAVGELAADVVP